MTKELIKSSYYQLINYLAIPLRLLITIRPINVDAEINETIETITIKFDVSDAGLTTEFDDATTAGVLPRKSAPLSALTLA